MERLLLRPSEGAQVVGLSRSKFYELLSSGQIPSITIGKARRVVAEDLRAWVEAQKQATQTDAQRNPE